MDSFLVTGGAGFIGSHLVDSLLAAGQHVRVLEDLSSGRRANLDPRAKLIEGDVTDAALVAHVAKGVAGIYHLATIASVGRFDEDWSATRRANRTGTIAIFDAARQAGRVPVVYASSAAIYGDQGEGAIAETARPTPRSAYGADKLGSEWHATAGAAVHGVPSIGLRFFNVYGPRQSPSSPYCGIIGKLAAGLAADEPFTVHGDGHQVRDFVHVADVVAHLRAAMAALHQEAAPHARVFNVCTGRATSILDLIRIVADVAGRDIPVRHVAARSGDIRSSVGDPTAARGALGLSATVPLREGLRATFAAIG